LAVLSHPLNFIQTKLETKDLFLFGFEEVAESLALSLHLRIPILKLNQLSLYVHQLASLRLQGLVLP
jgi:hypothetical protein